MIKRLPTTPFAEDTLVYSCRMGYLYGDGKTVSEVKHIEDFLFEILHVTGGLTRAQLCKYTNLARTTIYDSLVRLMEKDKITTLPIKVNKRGRPKVIFITFKE